MRTLAILACAASLAACATTEETVNVPYSAQPATIVAGASQVNVTVRAADARTTNRGRISTKINGYGMEMAAIRSERDVAETVRDALSAELKARGYNLAPGGPVVNAAVDTFYADFKSGILAGKANGDVQLTVTVADAGGAERYRSVIRGAGSKTVQLASGSNAADALSRALGDAMSKLFADPAFLKALR